jgi:autotransporter-associated beta strand protein
MTTLTFANNVTQPGTITASTNETTPPTPSVDNITVNAGVTVESTGGDVSLLAADDVVVNGSVVSDIGDLDLRSGLGDNDNEGIITLAGLVSVRQANTVAINVNSTNSAIANGGVTETGGGRIISGGVLLLNLVAGANAFTLTGANAVNGLAANINAPLTFNDTVGLLIGGESSSLEGQTVFGINTNGHNLTLSAPGLTIENDINAGSAIVDLSASAGGIIEIRALLPTITAGTLQSTSGANGTVKLVGPNSIAVLGNFAVTGGDFILNNVASLLTVSGAVSANSIFLSNSGALTITGGLSTPGSVEFSASGLIALDVALINVGSVTVDPAGGTLVFNDGTVMTTGAQAYHEAVTLGRDTALTSHAGGNITFDSTIDTNGKNLTLSTAGSGFLSGVISGSGSFTQDGSGTTTLIAVNTYSGATSAIAGTLLVDGSIASSSTTVFAHGTLGGTGVTGTVSMVGGNNFNPGGTLAPGDNGTGLLTTASLSMQGGPTLAIELGGTNAGFSYDQVAVNGNFSLSQNLLIATLPVLHVTLVNGFHPAGGEGFTIVNITGAGTTTGIFQGLPEGATLTLAGGERFTISYHGGDGNDVVLTALNQAPVNAVPATQEIEANVATAIAGLSMSDDGGSGSETTTLSVMHGTLTVAAVGGASVAGSGTGTVTINGTIAQIDATLSAANNVVYQGVHDFFGADTLTMVTNDNDNSGGGGAQSATTQLTIHVNTLIAGTSGNDSYTALPGNERIDGHGGIDTITFNFRLADTHVSFVGNEVIVDGPSGSHTVLTGFSVYHFTDGTVNENDGDPLVDDLYYYANNHDVWAAGIGADAHYHAGGWTEGRDPNAFFSTSTYLSLSPSVKAAGVDPLVQFDQGGWKTSDPSISFDIAAYLKANPDVAAAGVDPLAQFLQYGESEGRQPIAPLTLVAPNGFDYVYYLQHNPDVAAAHVDPFVHYETIGWKEGRNPNAYFDTSGYLAHNPDVAAAGVNPLDQYDQNGWKEGRNPSVSFDSNAYLAAYPDVAAAHIDPLVHFLQHGLQEGRSPHGDGSFF